MSALVVIDLEVHDRAKMDEYEKGAIELLARHGARPIVREQRAENYEGDWSPNFLVILEFPSRQAVRKFYDSEEYQPLKALRQQAAHSNGIIVADRLEVGFTHLGGEVLGGDVQPGRGCRTSEKEIGGKKCDVGFEVVGTKMGCDLLCEGRLRISIRRYAQDQSKSETIHTFMIPFRHNAHSSAGRISARQKSPTCVECEGC